MARWQTIPTTSPTKSMPSSNTSASWPAYHGYPIAKFLAVLSNSSCWGPSVRVLLILWHLWWAATRPPTPAQHRVSPEMLQWLCDNVLSKFPGVFGHDSETQRKHWVEQLLWAITIVDTRSYGKFGLFVITPFLDMVNHKNGGSVSFHSTPTEGSTDVHAVHVFATFEYAPVWWES
jgi:hypothetical protein